MLGDKHYTVWVVEERILKFKYWAAMTVDIKTISLFISEFSVIVFGHSVSEGIPMEHRKRKIVVVNLHNHKF